MFKNIASAIRNLFFYRKHEISRRKWIYIPIEVATRELESSILLACEAAGKGWGVLIGNIKTPKGNLSIPKGILITRWIKPGIKDKLVKFKKQGWLLVGWC